MKSDHVPSIHHPCRQPWKEMSGDARKRFCAQCEKHVHNLSEMSADEREALLAAEPTACISYNVDARGNFVGFHQSNWFISLFTRLRFATFSLAVSLVPFCFSSCVTRTGGPPAPMDKELRATEGASAKNPDAKHQH